MVTLKDLAIKLNVSVSTVSKALHDNPEISQETINRVKDLAKLYNYQPNKIALSLKANETKTVGVIIPSILNRFFAKVLFGLEKEARNNGYNIITCISNEQLAKEKECIQLLSNGSVDGFIIAVAEETQNKKDFSHFEATQFAKIPLVMFDRVIDEFICDKVIINDFQACKNATLELLKSGKKNIAFISAIDDLNVGKLRFEGYIDALEETPDVIFNPVSLIIQPNSDTRSQIEEFLINNREIDGIISADNVSGTICISVANNLGYDIPSNLSVIGFADEQISNLSVPKLSIINQNAEQIGENAFKLMLNRLSDKTNSKPFIKQEVATTFSENQSF